MRISSTVALSIGFVVLMVTGVLMFSSAYDYLTSALHIWSAVLVLLCVILHFCNNWKPYRNHLKKRIGKKTFALVLLGFIPVSAGLMLEKAPFSSLIQLGESLRVSGGMHNNEYTVLDLRTDNTSPVIELFAKVGDQYESPPQSLMGGLISYTSLPQVAVWLEDLSGNYIDTLYVTKKMSNSSFNDSGFNNKIIRRPEALPHWSHQRGVKAGDGLWVPEAGSVEFDALTAATPVGDHVLRLTAKRCKSCKVKIEINRTYDFNDYYSKDRFPDDNIFNGSGSSGQPSLIYQAIVDMSTPGKSLFQLIGHGHYSGMDGNLYSDLSKVTTAKEIFDFFVLMVR